MWSLLLCFLAALSRGGSFVADDSSIIGPSRAGKRQLMYLNIITTNGFYAPLRLYPNDENTEDDWPDGMGELTKVGKLQMYKLGKFLRQKYSNFITSNPKEVDAFSAADDRSTISLLSFLASLYEPTRERQFVPGFRWQPITLSYMVEDDIFFSFNDMCQKLFDEREIMFKSKHVQNLMRRDKFFYEFWSKHSGMNLTNWIDVAFLHDTIDKEDRMGLKVPRWARMHQQDMKRIADMAYTYTYNSTTSLSLKLGNLLELISLRMKVRLVQQEPVSDINVSVYVTHDWNLAALLSAMRLSNGKRPPPGATVTMEMYRGPGKSHSVRMLFFNSTTPETGQQDTHLLRLDGCTEYCPLHTFLKFLKRYIPDNWKQLCGRRVTTPRVYGEEEGTVDPLYPMFQDLKVMTLPTEPSLNQ